MDKFLDSMVRSRAGNRCEYCQLPQSVREFRFPIDHIIARQHGGPTVLSNLALCCGRCNLHKGPNLSGIDPISGGMVRLFHPRVDLWNEHFQWNGEIISALTPIGRATIAVLMMNHPDDVEIRRELIAMGVFYGS